jgi:hypothetical protein
MRLSLRKYFENYSAFFRGIGGLSIFSDNNYKPYRMKNNLTPEEQDALAIKGDWEAVGNDMRISMDKSKKTLSNRL